MRVGIVPAPVARVRHRWAGLALTLAATAVAVVLLRRSLPDPGTVLRALAAAQWWWLGLAVAFQAGAILMYAVQQRLLLAAFGGRMSTTRSVGLTLARATLSTAMPAGGPVSTAFAVRQFRAHGVTGAAALATAVLASVQASATVLLVYLGLCVGAGLANMHTADLPAVGTGLLVLCAAVVVALRVLPRVAWRRTALPAAPPGPRQRENEHWTGTIARWARMAVGLGADTTRTCASLSRRDWLTTGGAAVARRLFDLACLATVAAAYRLDAGIAALVGAYLAGLLLRQIPLAAGGAGLIEASLLASLVAVGADSAAAAAVVLAYRLLTCWLTALAGLPMLITLGAAQRGATAPRTHDASGTLAHRALEPDLL